MGNTVQQGASKKDLGFQCGNLAQFAAHLAELSFLDVVRCQFCLWPGSGHTVQYHHGVKDAIDLLHQKKASSMSVALGGAKIALQYDFLVAFTFREKVSERGQIHVLICGERGLPIHEPGLLGSEQHIARIEIIMAGYELRIAPGVHCGQFLVDFQILCQDVLWKNARCLASTNQHAHAFQVFHKSGEQRRRMQPLHRRDHSSQ